MNRSRRQEQSVTRRDLLRTQKAILGIEERVERLERQFRQNVRRLQMRSVQGK
jgi:hypothetical protein